MEPTEERANIQRKERYVSLDAVLKCVDEDGYAGEYDLGYGRHNLEFQELIKEIPAADVVAVRQIRAFIDRLIAERDKYDLHSMRWEHYDCDRLLIEQMLDEIDGERKGGDE